LHTLKEKLALTDYKSQTCTTKFTDRLQKSDIDYKVLLIDYKSLQKSDIDYKNLLIPLTTVIDIYLLCPLLTKGYPKSTTHPKQISDGEMVGVCREILQEPYSIFGSRNFIHRRAAQAKTHPRCAL